MGSGNKKKMFYFKTELTILFGCFSQIDYLLRNDSVISDMSDEDSFVMVTSMSQGTIMG